MSVEKKSTLDQVTHLIAKSGMQLRSIFHKIVAKRSSLWQVGWLLAATIIAGGFNYLANVLVGKLLGPEAYGVYAALLVPNRVSRNTASP